MTVMTAYLAIGPGHPWFGAAMMFALLGPVLHALRYPGMWLESFSLAFAICGMLSVATWGGMPTEPTALVGQFLMTALVGFALFMLGCVVQGHVYDAGPSLAVSWRVRGISKLPAAEMLPKLHLSQDDHWTVTPTDEDGLYALSIAFEIASPDLDDDGEGVNETLSQDFFMKVLTDTDTVHEYITFEDANGPVTANRYEVRSRSEGCEVFMSERATMSLVLCVGFWLTDHMGDYLMSRIDAAEGRPRRSNRSRVHNQLIVDIARLFSQPRGEGDIRDK